MRHALAPLAVGVLLLSGGLACSGGGSVAQQVSGPLYQVSGKTPGALAVQGNGYIDSTGAWVMPPPVTGPSVIGAAPVALPPLDPVRAAESELTKWLALDCEMVGVGPRGSKSALAQVAIVNDRELPVYVCYVKPAEFVVFAIGQWDGGALIEE